MLTKIKELKSDFQYLMPYILIYLLGSFFLVLENHKFLGMYSMNGFNWIDLWENWHTKLINFQGEAPNQYRFLNFSISEMFVKIFQIKAFYAYQLQTFICTFLSCVTLHLFFKTWLNKEKACIGVLVFLLINTLSMFYFIQPSEPLNILFFCLASLFLSRNQLKLSIVLILIGALNKLTIIFIVPLIFFNLLFSQTFSIRNFIRAASYSLITLLGIACVQLSIMNYTGKKHYYCEFWQYLNNINKLENSLLAWTFVIIAILPLLIIWKTWKQQPVILRASSLMSIFFIFAHFMIAAVDEFRVFIPLLCYNIPALLLFLNSKASIDTRTAN